MDDVDAFFALQSRQARSDDAAGRLFWGDRYGVVEDPFGHHWSIATHKRDVSPDEMRQAMKAAGPQGPS